MKLLGQSNKIGENDIWHKGNLTKLSDLVNDIGEGGGSVIKTNITLQSVNWAYDASLGVYTYTLSDKDITATSMVDVNIKFSYLDIAMDLLPANESYSGYLMMYANAQPEADIVCDIKITK